MDKQSFTDKQLALETINASVDILRNFLGYIFEAFPQKNEMTNRFISSYKREITEWLNHKCK